MLKLYMCALSKLLEVPWLGARPDGVGTMVDEAINRTGHSGIIMDETSSCTGTAH